MTSADVMGISKPFLTVADLAARYQCSKRTIYRWLRLEEKPFPKPRIEQAGISSLWAASDVLKWENSK